MADSLKTQVLSALTALTTPADSDLFAVGTSNGGTMKKITFADLFNAIKSEIPTVTFTQELKTVNLSASTSYAVGSISIGKSGYTAIGIAGWQTSDSANIFAGKIMMSGDTLYYTFRKANYSSGSWNGTANIRISYAKTS
nr:MAG TPA: hypothetical protein [Caudoviricetes sp.]DAP85605.1 MAG TPA: hypothetical protein [Caudoviricetes sp.]